MALFIWMTTLIICVTSDIADPRRLQFDTTKDTTLPPTVEVTPGPTPDANTLYRSVDEPYILVDFGNFVPWNDAQSYCKTQIGTNLASVWRNQTQVLTEQEQIDWMVLLTEGDGTTQYPGIGGLSAWIGLRYYTSGSEFFRWKANGQYLDDESTNWWIPGSTVPTAYYFQSGSEDTFCVAMMDAGNGDYYWNNEFCEGNDAGDDKQFALCENPDWKWHPTDPSCDNGLLTGSGYSCCPLECGSCGGSGCSGRPGGATNCCGGRIQASGVYCSDAEAPCIMILNAQMNVNGSVPEEGLHTDLRFFIYGVVLVLCGIALCGYYVVCCGKRRALKRKEDAVQVIAAGSPEDVDDEKRMKENEELLMK